MTIESKETLTQDSNLDLAEENKRLIRANRRLERDIERQKDLVKRNKIALDTKKQVNEIVRLDRTKLERNMNLLLSSVRDFILFFNTSGQLQYCSDSFLHAMDISSSALIKGRKMSEILGDIFPPENIGQIIQLAHDFADGLPVKTIEMSLRLDLCNRETFRDYLVEVNILINDENESEGFVMLFYDTTELMDARREAEKANAVKSDFLATISHEIRTPMNAVIGLTDMIKDTQLDERQTDLVTKIQTSSTNLLEIINDLLDFSKIEAGKVEIIDEYFDLPELLAGVKSLFALMMAQKSLAFICNFADDLPQVIYSDSKRVRQILINLLNNAYKYTTAGSVTVNVSAIAGDRLHIAVSDTGIGIKEEERYRLFKEFEQLDQVRNKHVTGTGLGLAITKRLCELMGGSIDVKSVYGEGSTFIVELPFTRGTEVDLPQKEDATPKFTARNARILIVDDVEINLEITRFLLEAFKVQTDIAYDGQEAIDMVANEHYDMILMDHMMPVMDGIEATQIIRSREKDEHIPIVALTANAISGVEGMFKKEGFDGFISKPIDADNLARSLYELLPRELIDTPTE
jgi:signal transduction histidine kinase/ActR/RegA family two-component response regulator